MTPSDPIWFYWPITFASCAAVASAHLSVVRRREATGGLPLGLLAVVAVALPVVPLMIGVHADCNDTGHGINFNVPAFALGAVGIVAWLGVVMWLYRMAGLSVAAAQRLPVALFFGIIIGMLIEFFVSSISLEGYCNSTSSWMFGQLGVACLLAAAGAVGVLAKASSTVRRR